MAGTSMLLSWLNGFFAAVAPSLIVLAILTVIYIIYITAVNRNLPPGPKPWPLVGSLPLLARVGKNGTSREFYASLVEKYGPVSSLLFGSRPMVFLGTYDVVHEAMVKQAEYFKIRPEGLVTIEDITQDGKGVALGNGFKWWEMRKTVLPALTGSGVGRVQYEDVVMEEVKALEENISQTNGQPFTTQPLLDTFVNKILCRILLGERYSTADKGLLDFSKALEDISSVDGFLSLYSALPAMRYVPGINKKYNLYLEYHARLAELIKERLEARKAIFDKDHVTSIMDVLLKEQAASPDSTVFTDGNMVRGLADLFMAGSKASSLAHDWFILYMIAYPDVQSRCREEIAKVSKKADGITLADMTNLPYLCATVREVSRLANVVPLSVPHSTTKDVKLNGFLIPKDAIVMTNTAAVHMDKTQWIDPEKFDPGRFLDEEGKLTYRPALMPLGIGPRKCPAFNFHELGQFLLVSSLLRTFLFSKKEGVSLSLDGTFDKGMFPAPYEVVASKL